MKRYRNISLKNKIFLSILGVIMVISVIIALLARWILLSSLTSELEHRGVAIAQSVADRGSGYVLDGDFPSLTALIFDVSMLGERRDLVSYIYVAGPEVDVLAHTFIRPFPREILGTNLLAEEVQAPSVRPILMGGETALDIAVPVLEGIYRIATVHVGLNQRHIDNLVSKLRITFLGFITLVIVIIFWISHRISGYITLPVTKLIKMSDEISKGNLNFKLDLGKQYEDLLVDQESGERCPAYHNSDLPCWHVDKTMGPVSEDAPRPKKPPYCRECVIRHKQIGDEVLQLADSFTYMVRSIKLYRNRLNESEAKYRSLFDAGPDPIFVIERSSLDILDVNPRASELYGYGLQEFHGKSFLDLEAEGEMGTLKSFEALTADNGGSVFYPKAIHRKADGQTFFVNMHASATAYGGHEALIVSTTDITDIIEKDAQLIQASKMTTLGEMSAGIAHELNQPLNAIKMGSDFLSMIVGGEGEVPEDQLEQVTGQMSEQVDRATEIINTLRQFGRMSDLTPEKLDINDPVRAIQKIIGRQMELQSIALKLDLGQDLKQIQAHGNRLQQVFFNLVSNARDAINVWSDPEDSDPRERQITIRTFEEDGRVAIAVSDTGVGIDQTQVDKIFEPFFTTKETGKGMGLGLAISYGIVKDYGGEISVTSKIGAGTTFKLMFPPAA
ncbi:ATP-binding protein [Desulfovibrio ferrophilus]|uniref:histidine kinase n=1 Tax=Desulfovibrio ferrophilus TaxID=241368 RepID=A0A2Z6AVZ5_9BACT|nr:ATP-binding protein [Desulfovibrio ferrophilus]BBD07345.1 PAS domain S-box [Desulfovibrio ferrophilus]